MNARILNQHPDATSYAGILLEHEKLEWALAAAELETKAKLENPRSTELAAIHCAMAGVEIAKDFNLLVIGLLHDIIEFEKNAKAPIDPLEIRGYVKEAIRQAKEAEKEIAREREIADLVKYAQECKVAHVEMWDWISKNPGADKSDWPGWEKFSNGIEAGYQAIRSSCFACEIAEEINFFHNPKTTDKDDICYACPLTWGDEGQSCLEEEFIKWVRAPRADKEKLATEIRDKEWTLTINEKEITLGNEDERPAEVADRAA